LYITSNRNISGALSLKKKDSANGLDDIAQLIDSSTHITVFTGAGISTSCGIPDFRSEKGLYSLVKNKYSLPYPEAVFDISFFNKNPKPFFELSRDFFSANIEPSLSHKFIAWLEVKNKISLVVTQNIDMLHQKAGTKKILQCHGTYETARCIKCNKNYSLEDIKEYMKKGEVPFCSCGGYIKPDIVFFGEQLPLKFYDYYESPPETDLLLAMGSSLTVQPAASFALKLAVRTRSILVNLSPTEYDDMFTYSVHEDLDTFSRKVWDLLRK
jgi:NAD-dependent SIR2 family protein deacetylase